MYKELLRSAPEVCIDRGQQVLSKLRADPLLCEAAEELGVAQDKLVRRFKLHRQALDWQWNAIARREEAVRGMRAAIRVLAQNLLALNGNRHDSDWYRRYFSKGYRFLTRGTPRELWEEGRVLIRLLEQETDPWILSVRERLVAATEALAEAVTDAEQKIKEQEQAFQLLMTEKRPWVTALAGSRLKVQRVYLDDKPYVRFLYHAVAPKRKTAPAMSERPRAVEEAGEEETTGGPADVISLPPRDP